MQFTVDVYEDTPNGRRRVETFTGIEKIRRIHVLHPHSVVITDNLTKQEWDFSSPNSLEHFKSNVLPGIRPFSNVASATSGEVLADEAHEAAARAAQWKPEKPFSPSMSLQEVAAVMAKPVNLKNAVGLQKAPLHPVPPIAYIALGQAMADGKFKYDLYNWRDTEATVSVFIDAILRHVFDYISGVDHASDSKVHHLAHVMAGCAIILDAELHGKLVDDRHKVNGKTIVDMLKLLKAA